MIGSKVVAFFLYFEKLPSGGVAFGHLSIWEGLLPMGLVRQVVITLVPEETSW